MPYRVLVVAHGHPELSVGGAEVASHLLFRGLQQTEGVEAYFLAWAGDAARERVGTPFSAFRGRPDEILFFTDDVDPFLFSQRSSDLIERFASLVAQIDPQVIHFHHYTNMGLELIAVARRVNPRLRIIVTLHEYLAICHHYGQMVKVGTLALCNAASPHDCANCFKDIAPSEFLLRELFIKAHFEKVDLFIAPSEFLRQRYIGWGLPSWQITVLDNGILPIRPPPPRPLAEAEGRTVFGFFGQINPYKGLVPLLSAFELLDRFPAESTRGLRLIVHGADLDLNHPQYVDLVKQMLSRTARRVHFAGSYRRQDQYRLLAAVDWVIVPSIWWENSPLVIQEAFAHRRPVICSDIGGMAEKVRPGMDGFHFAVGNPFELASLMVRLTADPAIWDDLQRTIRAPTSVADCVGNHLQLYQDEAFAVAH